MEKEQWQSLCSDKSVCIGASLHFAYMRAHTEWVGSLPLLVMIVWCGPSWGVAKSCHLMAFLSSSYGVLTLQKWGKVLTKLIFFLAWVWPEKKKKAFNWQSTILFLVYSNLLSHTNCTTEALNGICLELCPSLPGRCVVFCFWTILCIGDRHCTSTNTLICWAQRVVPD